jgi:hypothetical protein
MFSLLRVRRTLVTSFRIHTCTNHIALCALPSILFCCKLSAAYRDCVTRLTVTHSH